ncbi:MAG: hypothetical protein WCV82_00630 [Candidatus Paceibacterota bacterium]
MNTHFTRATPDRLGAHVNASFSQPAYEKTLSFAVRWAFLSEAWLNEKMGDLEEIFPLTAEDADPLKVISVTMLDHAAKVIMPDIWIHGHRLAHWYKSPAGQQFMNDFVGNRPAFINDVPVVFPPAP